MGVGVTFQRYHSVFNQVSLTAAVSLRFGITYRGDGPGEFTSFSPEQGGDFPLVCDRD